MTVSGRLPASLLRLKERHRQLTTGRQDSHTVMNYHFSMTALDGIQLLHLKRCYVFTLFNLQPGMPTFPVHVSHPKWPLLCCISASHGITVINKQGSSNLIMLFSGGNLVQL